ncbi:MAG: 3,4-dihydroxy-2-butanone-4-phosphate synthase [Bdellovibrionales bacterium RIFCSPHIGHO2_01_FULL_40_29]|nr:MAG: 3,4-dihydroxy-2-butanone-4-phosphate synthase [Bdellovibrionales bacterium RIFCSPHIGHO2_01_FULL_40_29]OFZ33939.1 MAG: 3,4-dihydroxy-2-butanone-4-phosphate synthase [Bdellovibrionales bacterium RIFCSPHIGHO2_02_FULL_40_15]
MNSIDEILADFKNGKFVILVDDEDRENEGDLILAADFVTANAVNFLAKEARGLICLALSPQQVDRLQLPMMKSAQHQVGMTNTAFTYSIEASTGVTTGISAADRAHTIKVASHPLAKPSDVICPGHIFPLRANPDGVLGRPGHTEASVDLAILSGLSPASIICEVINDDGSMARLPELKIFAKKFDLKIGSIADLISYRKKL